MTGVATVLSEVRNRIDSQRQWQVREMEDGRILFGTVDMYSLELPDGVRWTSDYLGLYRPDGSIYVLGSGGGGGGISLQTVNIAGTKDGVNTTFTLPSASITYCDVYLNGIRQVEGITYTRVGLTITAIGAGTPQDVTDTYQAVVGTGTTTSAPTVVTISGTKDGVNTAFTIPDGTVSLVIPYLNGMILSSGVGFTRAGANITAMGAGVPQSSGDTFEAIVFPSGGSSTTPSIASIAGTKDGVNTAFTIPDGTVSLCVPVLNGIVQSSGVGFTRAGANITAIGAGIPNSGDTYEAIVA